MSRRICVYGLPELLDPADLRGDAAIAIDVLRATTTIVTAISNGAKAVYPFLEIEETETAARKYAETHPEEPRPVLGGERGGKPISGFDIGNSPLEYTPDKIGGKVVFFTTTNGTRALNRVRGADLIVPGSFLNAGAVVEKLVNRECIHIVCAGTDGSYTEEDMLLAGLFVERFLALDSFELNIEAVTVREKWRENFLANVSAKVLMEIEPIPIKRLCSLLRTSRGGRNLVEIGMEKDVEAASQLDILETVPVLDSITGRIS